MSKNFYFVEDNGDIRKLTTSEVKDIASQYVSEYPRSVSIAWDIICNREGYCDCDSVCHGYEEAKAISENRKN